MEALRAASALAVLLALLCAPAALACNEAVCASIVSKCMLTGSCKCDMTDMANCTCCKECSECLDTLYEECCYCFKMCPKPERSWADLAMHSQHHEIPYSSNAALFRILTSEPDASERWISYTFPADHQSFEHSNTKYQIRIVSVDKDAPAGEQTTVSEQPVNCTAAYLTQCRSWLKCSDACRSMGASSFRWFHNGCCECIGSTLDDTLGTLCSPGINESRCLRCSEDDNEEVPDDELDETLMAYGDDPANVLK